MRWPIPTHAWAVWEQGGTVLSDAMAGLDGTIAGSPVWIKEDFGVALQFDASDDLVDLGTGDEVTGRGTWTLGFIVRLDGDAPAAGYSLYRRQTNDAGASGAFEVRVGSAAGDRKVLVRTDDANAHTSTFELRIGYNFLVLTSDGTTLRLYLDGAPKDALAYTEPTDESGLEQRLGAYDDDGTPSLHLLGALAGVFFWDGLEAPAGMVEAMYFDPWRPFTARRFPHWLTKRKLIVAAPGGGAGTGTNDPTAYDPFTVLTGTTLRQLYRDGELAPVELLEIYLDPTDFSADPDYAFVSQPMPFVFENRLYDPLGWRRGPLSMSDDTAADLLNLAITDMDTRFAQLAQKVQLGGARVEVYQVFAGHLASGLKRTIFKGKGKEPSFSQGRMTWEIVSYLHLIDTEVPKRQFSRMCQYRLGDGSCGVALSSHTQTGNADAGSDALNVIDTTNLTQADDDHWDAGYVEITEDDHALKGVQRPVWRFYPESDRLRMRWPFPSSTAGLDFKVVRGCKKTKDDCEDRFDNLPKYGGFAEVPMARFVPVGKGR